MKKIVALIPARLNASRFPQKLMKELDGKTIILRTYEAIKAMNLFDDVVVVCDEDTILNEILKNGGRAVLSTKEYESGTDRIAEIAAKIEADIIVNVQGDEPFVSKDALQKVIALFNNSLVEVGSLILPITDKATLQNPNCVKVVVDKNFKALYFSRSPIPYVRDENTDQIFYKHIGVYAFKKETLLAFTQLPISQLERTEKLENLRMLENGMNIYMAVVNEVGISIDTPEDFERAKKYLNESGA
jgi:3-deoxy-D-manno-octulosonate cytidylyltransferase